MSVIFLVVYALLSVMTLTILAHKKMYVSLGFYTAGFVVMLAFFGIYCLTDVLPAWATTFVETVGDVHYMFYLVAVLVSLFTCLTAFFVVGTVIKEHRRVCARAVKRLSSIKSVKFDLKEVILLTQQKYCLIHCRYNC